MITYQQTRALATANDIAPGKCDRCRQVPSTGLSWQYGYDDGTDPQYVGYQCRNCGGIQGMSRKAILARIRARLRT